MLPKQTQVVPPPSTAAPTSLDQILSIPGATYFNGFERAIFPNEPEWSTVGDGLWGLDTERTNTGLYSIKSPDLSNEDLTPQSSNVTFTTNLDSPPGTLYFSILAGVDMPFDDVVYFLDGEQRGQASSMTDFESRTIDVPGGQHDVTFVYNYNPLALGGLPPPPPERIGAAFIDDVYFLPEGITLSPTVTPGVPEVTLNPSSASSIDTLTTLSPNEAPTTPSPVLATNPPTQGSTTAPPISSQPTPLETNPPTAGSSTGSTTDSTTDSTVSNSPTPGSVPATSISPTAPAPVPPGATYFDSFEKASFPDDPGWSLSGTELWELTTERAKSGIYSIKSPDLLNPDDITPNSSNVTLTTGPEWPAGTLVFSVLAGTQMPFDDLSYFLDGQQRGQSFDMTDFENRVIQMPPGQHNVTFAYRFNPNNLDGLPPIPVDRIGEAFIDNVYFLPEGTSMSPTVTPGAPLPAPGDGTPSPSGSSNESSPTKAPSYFPSYVPTAEPVGDSTPPDDGEDGEPTKAPSYYPSYNPTGNPQSVVDEVTQATGGPTSIPAGSVYYDSFEQVTFPNDPEWSTDEVNPWILNTENAKTGVYSIKSPDLSNDEFIPTNSNVTLSFLDPDFEGGTLVLSVIPGVEPFDNLAYYDNGQLIGVISAPKGVMGEFETLQLLLTPGPHDITLEYKYNPYGLDALPPAMPDMLGSVYVDDVYILPPASSLPIVNVSESLLFDGFESGDYSGNEGVSWRFSGEEAWNVDDTNPFEGRFAAHVKTEDISNGNYSQLDLDVSLDSAAFIQFYFNAPVAMPFDQMSLLVDEQFLTNLATEGGMWAQAGAVLSSGDHTISWRQSNNPGGAPEEALAGLEQPAFRTGEAWIDNVQLLPSTPSFTEDFESGTFTAHPWVLSGDGEWKITDLEKNDGVLSATMATAAIEENSGVGELSMDIITERGGTLEFQILHSVADPFEVANVLLDDIAVLSYSTVSEDWLAQEIDIQPGKRKVTFQLQKNSGGLPEDVLSDIPAPPGREGQIWLDGIVFTENTDA